jgi:hypothetical protein
VKEEENEVEVISEGRRESSRSDQPKEEENEVEVISRRKNRMKSK